MKFLCHISIVLSYLLNIFGHIFSAMYSDGWRYVCLSVALPFSKATFTTDDRAYTDVFPGLTALVPGTCWWLRRFCGKRVTNKCRFKSTWQSMYGQEYCSGEVEHSIAQETLVASDGLHGCECREHPIEATGGSLSGTARFIINSWSVCGKREE